MNLRRAGSIVASGTIVIAIDGAFTFTLAQAYTSALGDVLELRGQATADTALANVSVTLLATI